MKKLLFFGSFFLVLFGITHYWLLGEQHFFVFDDASHLLVLQQKKISDFISFIPVQIYNDRPIGQLFLDVLHGFFGLNWRGFHLSLVLVHFANAILVFLVSKKLFSWTNLDKDRIARIATLNAGLFLLWPSSGLAYWWISAIFDLWGTLLGLLFFYLVFDGSENERRRILSFIVAFFILILAVRTKEFFLTLPFLSACLIFLFSRKKQSTATVFILACSALYCVGYFLLLLKARPTGGVESPESPYFLSFNFLSLAKSALRYLAIFFDFKSANFSYERPTLMSYLPVLILVLLFLMFTRWKLSIQIIFVGVLLYLMALGPVLPMKNMQHRLYIYFPSVFLFGAFSFVVFCGHKLIKGVHVQARRVCLAVFAVVFTYLAFEPLSGWSQRKSIWLKLAEQDRVSLESFSAINKHGTTTFMVVDESQGYNILDYGPANLLKVFYHKPQLEFKVVDTISEACQADSKVLVLRSDYRFEHINCN